MCKIADTKLGQLTSIMLILFWDARNICETVVELKNNKNTDRFNAILFNWGRVSYLSFMVAEIGCNVGI